MQIASLLKLKHVKNKPRGRAFAKGHHFGKRFQKGDPQINRSGPAPVNSDLLDAYYAELAHPVRMKEIPRSLRPNVRAFVGDRTPTLAQVVACAVGARAIAGDVACARELRRGSEDIT